MAVARWLRGRTKLASVLGLLKDQTAAGIAWASGPFSRLQIAVVMATNHQESLPEESYVEEILAAGAGSRMRVAFCTRLLVKRLKKTQNWAVAVKCLVILHRTMLDGGFLFQDLLTYTSLREGKEYLTFSKPNQTSEFSFWVTNYAQYLDERLRCAHALKSHLDHRWKGEITQHRVEYMESEELLYQLEALQNLLQELYQCKPGAEVGSHPVIQRALVLVLTDSFKVVHEIRFRIKELLGRVDVLALPESLAVLHNCKRADIQMQALDSFLETCKQLRLLSEVPIPRKAMVAKLEIKKLTESIQSSQKEPSAPSFTRSVSTGGKMHSGSLPLQNTARQPLRIHGPGILQRTTSQPMREFSSIPEELPYAHHSSADLIDLSFDTDFSRNAHKNPAPAPQNTFRDLITF